MKRKSDLDLDVKMAKTKQSFDIGLRKFHAFTLDWNQSKAAQITQHFRLGPDIWFQKKEQTFNETFSSGFIRLATDIIDQLRTILTGNLETELEALQILERINMEINLSSIVSVTSKNLQIEVETEVEPKLLGKYLFTLNYNFYRTTLRTKLEPVISV